MRWPALSKLKPDCARTTGMTLSISQLHIGFYAPAWPPSKSANGIVTYVKTMSGALKTLGHRVSIVSDGTLFGEGGVRRSLVSNSSTIRRKIRALVDHFDLKTGHIPVYGRRLAAQIAFAHTLDPFDVFEMEESFGWARHIAEFAGPPTVLRLHGPHFLGQCDVHIHAMAKRSQQRCTAEGEAIRAASVVTAPSLSLLERTLAEYGCPRRAAAFIPNPVDPVAAEDRWSLESCDKDLILFVGRFDRRKGADIALSAFSEVAQKHSSARLVMVGPDSGLQVEQKYLQFADYVACHLKADVVRRVSFLGLRHSDEIADLRRRTFLTIVSSRYESFPYSVAEAMAAGCPVIATRVFGTAEMIVDRQTGWLVDVENPAHLAGAINEAFESPSLAARLGHASWERCRSQYASQKIANDTLAVYHQLLENSVQ